VPGLFVNFLLPRLQQQQLNCLDYPRHLSLLHLLYLEYFHFNFCRFKPFNSSFFVFQPAAIAQSILLPFNATF
jgi:hypothetical protein